MHEAGLLARGSDVRSAFPALASGIGKNLPLTVARAAPGLIPQGNRTGFPFHPQDAEPHAKATLPAKRTQRNTLDLRDDADFPTVHCQQAQAGSALCHRNNREHWIKAGLDIPGRMANRLVHTGNQAA